MQNLFEHSDIYHIYSQERPAAIAGRTRGLIRDKAAYLAGLSAYQLGDLYEAQRQLATAVMSTDRTTAGKAKAVLGLVRVKQHRSHEAAVLLAEASGALTGENSRQAAYQAALAHQAAGDETSAGTWFRIADAGQPTGQRALAINSRARAARFSLQAGAFRRRQHADKAARSVADVAQQHGLGGIRVIESLDDRGRILYFVQFGPTRALRLQRALRWRSTQNASIPMPYTTHRQTTPGSLPRPRESMS